MSAQQEKKLHVLRAASLCLRETELNKRAWISNH